MMGRAIIDLSINNLFACWRLFRQGKTASYEIIEFEYYLENNLRRLEADLNNGTYKHGAYRQFEATDSKRRLIRVAVVRDRVVHRLVYEYLKSIFDQNFIYDAWSCRKGKGLIEAIKRSQEFLRQRPKGYIWRSDIKKFFDNVDREILLFLIRRRVDDDKAISIIREIILSSPAQHGNGSKNNSIPIGNLASQIFANIYFNEFDRFIKHKLKIKLYLRYGDDFIILADKQEILEKIRSEAKRFLKNELRLETNCHRDIIIKASQGLKFLGAMIYPYYRRLNRRNSRRIVKMIDLGNLSSYGGLIRQYEPKKIREFNYLTLELLSEI